MPKNPLSLLIIVALIAVGIYMFNIFKKSNSTPKILETRDFSCPGMAGFTFKYPVFEGWEVKNISASMPEPEMCTILLNWPNTIRLDDTPRIVVLIEPIPGIPDKNGIVRDKARVYSDSVRKSFNAKTFFVDIDISSIPDKNGFSRDQFWKTVIESFRVGD